MGGSLVWAVRLWITLVEEMDVVLTAGGVN